MFWRKPTPPPPLQTAPVVVETADQRWLREAAERHYNRKPSSRPKPKRPVSHHRRHH